MIKEFAEHSIEINYLTGGICIDAGCRGFQFSEAMRDLGLKVLALDIEDMEVPEGITFVKAALWDKAEEVRYVDTEDKQAKFISEEGTIKVQATTLEDLYLLVGENIDVLKLDIEGCEWQVLMGMKRPVPKQITFELHQHTSKKRKESEIVQMFIHLQKWYNIAFYVLEKRHGLGENYWDVLFTRMDLAMTREKFLEGVGSWDNHRVLLWEALELTENTLTEDRDYPVAEFGAGQGSTPFLRQYCLENNRKFVSYENNVEWAEKCGSIIIDDWNMADIYKPYSVCLIDHSPGEHRHEAIAILKDLADIIVIHDSEAEATGYMLDKIWPLFKYRVNCKNINGKGAEASAVSNKIDLSRLAGITFGDFKITE